MSDPLKAFEVASKFAWPTFILTALILYAPDDHITGMNFSRFRAQYILELQIGLLFSAIIASSTVFPSRKSLWRLFLCPLKKLVFPLKDFRTGVKQSRMRYREVAIVCGGREIVYFQEVGSNGEGPLAYYDQIGHRAIPVEPYDGQRALGDWTHTPKWGRIDLVDLFNGNKNSGVWGISEPQ